MSAAGALFDGVRGLVRGRTCLDMPDLGKVRHYRDRHGKIRFEIDLRPNGRLHSFPTEFGPVGFASQQQAEVVLNGIRGLVASGLTIEAALARFQPRNRTLVGKRAEEWIKAKRRDAAAGRLSPRSVLEMECHQRLYWKRWERYSVEEITRGHLDEWLSELDAHGLARSTCRNVLALFRSFLRWLYAREEIKRVPPFPTVTVHQRVAQIMGLTDREKVLSAIPDEHRGIFLAMADLALRPNEARAVQAVDYDPADGGWLTIQRGARLQGRKSPTAGTKTGRVRRLPVTERIRVWIETHIERDARLRQAPLFPYRGGLYAHGWLVRQWRRACEAAGVAHVPMREATRHTTATMLRRRGAMMEDVQQLLGHTSMQHTERYVQDQGAALVGMIRREEKK